MSQQQHGGRIVGGQKGFVATDIETRFLSNLMPIPFSGCLIWMGAIRKSGHGIIYHHQGVGELVHRFAWKRKNSAIPNGLCVCHKCDVPSCVNPDHLFLGTHADNMRDMADKGRSRNSRGSANPRAKLSETKVLRMRKMFKMNNKRGSVTEIAKKFGIGRTTTSAIIRGKRWTHI